MVLRDRELSPLEIRLWVHELRNGLLGAVISHAVCNCMWGRAEGGGHLKVELWNKSNNRDPQPGFWRGTSLATSCTFPFLLWGWFLFSKSEPRKGRESKPENDLKPYTASS